MSIRSAIDFLTYGAEVRRYHTVATLREETVGHHSHGVAMLCLILNPGASSALLQRALAHDLAEQHVGDIPSPAKRSLGFSEKLDSLEENLIRGAMGLLPEITPAEQRVLKLADLAQGALFCTREMELGNRRMRVVFDRYISYAESMNLTPKEHALFSVIKEKAK